MLVLPTQYEEFEFAEDAQIIERVIDLRLLAFQLAVYLAAAALFLKEF